MQQESSVQMVEALVLQRFKDSIHGESRDGTLLGLKGYWLLAGLVLSFRFSNSLILLARNGKAPFQAILSDVTKTTPPENSLIRNSEQVSAHVSVKYSSGRKRI